MVLNRVFTSGFHLFEVGGSFLFGFLVISRFLLRVLICLSWRCVNRLWYDVVCCTVFWLVLEGFNFGFSSL